MTTFLRFLGYVLCAIFLFGVIFVIANARFKLNSKDEAAIQAEIQTFSEALQKDRVSVDAANRLASIYGANLKSDKHTILVAANFMAGASAIICGLLGVISILCARIKTLQGIAHRNRQCSESNSRNTERQ